MKMKKLVALVTAGVLCLGMSMTALAADLEDGSPNKPPKPTEPTTPTTPTTPNKPKGSNLPKTSEMINSLYNLIGFVMLALAGFGLVLAKKGKL